MIAAFELLSPPMRPGFPGTNVCSGAGPGSFKVLNTAPPQRERDAGARGFLRRSAGIVCGVMISRPPDGAGPC